MKVLLGQNCSHSPSPLSLLSIAHFDVLLQNVYLFFLVFLARLIKLSIVFVLCLCLVGTVWWWWCPYHCWRIDLLQRFLFLTAHPFTEMLSDFWLLSCSSSSSSSLNHHLKAWCFSAFCDFSFSLVPWLLTDHSLDVCVCTCVLLLLTFTIDSILLLFAVISSCPVCLPRWCPFRSFFFGVRHRDANFSPYLDLLTYFLLLFPSFLFLASLRAV